METALMTMLTQIVILYSCPIITLIIVHCGLVSFLVPFPTIRPVKKFVMDQLYYQAIKCIQFWKHALYGCLKIQSIHMGKVWEVSSF